jgi:hypothetical protein
MSLKALRTRAAKIGVMIEADRDDYGWSYWLLNTGWSDDNFCVDHDEIETKLDRLEAEQKGN